MRNYSGFLRFLELLFSKRLKLTKKGLMVNNFDILLAHNMNWSQATLKHTTNEAICYASTITTISDSDKAIIKHSRKTLIFHNKDPWNQSENQTTTLYIYRY